MTEEYITPYGEFDLTENPIEKTLKLLKQAEMLLQEATKDRLDVHLNHAYEHICFAVNNYQLSLKAKQQLPQTARCL